MYQSFLTFIEKKELLSMTDKVLLAVSGGVDSMVLLELVKRAGFAYGVAHVNYGLRGQASDLDMELVQEECERAGVEFHLHEVDQEVYTATESIQMIARNIRYRFFDQLVEKFGYSKVATAHNANDNLETVIFNLTKGTGVSGLTGIAAKKGKRIRPLLFAQKEAIYQYAKDHHLKWREDESNKKSDYHRNLIRNEVVPLLKQINPSLVETFKDSVVRFQGAAQVVERQKEAILSRHMVVKDGYEQFGLAWLTNDHQGLMLLFEILKSYGFNFRQVVDMAESIFQEKTGAEFYGGGFKVNVDRGKLLIEKSEQEEDPVSVTVGVDQQRALAGEVAVIFERVAGNEPIINASNIACLDAAKIRYPLTIRNWQNGDAFCPFGMSGKKKVSDFMIDSKIPVTLKKKVLILESNGQIVWVMGYRIDDRFKVTTATREMLKVTLSHA